MKNFPSQPAVVLKLIAGLNNRLGAVPESARNRLGYDIKWTVQKLNSFEHIVGDLLPEGCEVEP